MYHFIDEARWAADDLVERQIKASLFDHVNDKNELNAYRIRGFENNSHELINFFGERFCVLCFVRDSASEYMWREYAAAGHGVCFGFDVLTNTLTPVNYVPEVKIEEFPPGLYERVRKQKPRRGRLPTPVEKRAMQYINRFFTTKFDTYANEREIRALINRDQHENGMYFAKLGTNGIYLQEVILGPHCELSEDRIRELVLGYPRQPIIVRRHHW